MSFELYNSSLDNIEDVKVSFIANGNVIASFNDKTITGVNSDVVNGVRTLSFNTNAAMLVDIADTKRDRYNKAINVDSKMYYRKTVVKGTYKMMCYNNTIQIIAGYNGIETVRIKTDRKHYIWLAKLQFNGQVDLGGRIIREKMEQSGLSDRDFDTILINIKWKNTEHKIDYDIDNPTIVSLGITTKKVVVSEPRTFDFDIDKGEIGAILSVYKNKGIIALHNIKIIKTQPKPFIINKDFESNHFWYVGGNIVMHPSSQGRISRITFKCSEKDQSIKLVHANGNVQTAYELCCVMKMLGLTTSQLGDTTVEMHEIKKGDDIGKYCVTIIPKY